MQVCNALTAKDVRELTEQYHRAVEADSLIERWKVYWAGRCLLAEMRYYEKHPVRRQVYEAASRAGFPQTNTTGGRTRREQARYEADSRLRGAYEQELRESGYELDGALRLATTGARRRDDDYRALDALIAIVQRRVGVEGEPIKTTARALAKDPGTIRGWLDRKG